MPNYEDWFEIAQREAEKRKIATDFGFEVGVDAVGNPVPAATPQVPAPAATSSTPAGSPAVSNTKRNLKRAAVITVGGYVIYKLFTRKKK